MSNSLSLSVAASTVGLLSASNSYAQPQAQIVVSPSDESYWAKVAEQYQVTPSITNLDNGYYGIMTTAVKAQYHRHIDALNLSNSYYLRTTFDDEIEAARVHIAKVAGVLPEEIAITRGATEALQNLITNYNLIKPGDVAM